MSEARAILRCVDWMQRHQEPIDERMWEAIYDIAANSEADFRAKLRAWEMLADRVDPIPKPLIQAVVQGDLHVAWQAPSSPSPTALAPSKPSSTTPSPANGHARASSSSTDDLAAL